jgi:hypothetical protein
MDPCDHASYELQLVIASFTGVSTLLGVWLAHRRWMADQERLKFHHTMLRLHGLSFDESGAVSDPAVRRDDT